MNCTHTGFKELRCTNKSRLILVDGHNFTSFILACSKLNTRNPI